MQLKMKNVYTLLKKPDKSSVTNPETIREQKISNQISKVYSILVATQQQQPTSLSLEPLFSITLFKASIAMAFPPLKNKFVVQSLGCVRLLLRPHGLQPARFLCPWDFPGKNTRVGCHFLFQGIFLTQGLNPCLLHWQVNSLPLSHLGSL